jgi:hypothetical protein
MSSSTITEDWKHELINMDMDYGHHNPFKLIDCVKELIEKVYEEEKKYHIKHNIIKNVWYCDSLKDYIYFLEKSLNKSLKSIKKLEEGFDERNKMLKLEYKKVT